MVKELSVKGMDLQCKTLNPSQSEKSEITMRVVYSKYIFCSKQVQLTVKPFLL